MASFIFPRFPYRALTMSYDVVLRSVAVAGVSSCLTPFSPSAKAETREAILSCAHYLHVTSDHEPLTVHARVVYP